MMKLNPQDVSSILMQTVAHVSNITSQMTFLHGNKRKEYIGISCRDYEGRYHREYKMTTKAPSAHRVEKSKAFFLLEGSSIQNGIWRRYTLRDVSRDVRDWHFRNYQYVNQWHACPNYNGVESMEWNTMVIGGVLVGKKKVFGQP